MFLERIDRERDNVVTRFRARIVEDVSKCLLRVINRSFLCLNLYSMAICSGFLVMRNPVKCSGGGLIVRGMCGFSFLRRLFEDVSVVPVLKC